MLLYTVLSTFLYFQQAEIVDRTFADRGARTAFFAQVDLLVNVLTLGGQMFVTARVLQSAGVAVTLTFVSLLSTIANQPSNRALARYVLSFAGIHVA